MNERPLIAITMGDAAGIGPEITAKALAEPGVGERCRPVVVGAAWAIEGAVRLVRGASRVRVVSRPAEAQGQPGVIEVLETGGLRHEDVTPGRLSAACGRAAIACIEEAARLALAGEVAAMVTCPVHKEALQLAGAGRDIGHQEILARLAGAKEVATMLMTPGLRVAHLTTHKPLAEAARYVTKANVLAKLRLTHENLRRWGIERPRIAAAALNPHGGEGGLLGREELEQIGPAVEAARAEGIDARGPFPADSVFYRAIAGEFDAVLAMYHDQGHIAIKTHNFEDSVSVTLGIPFIRTSVDHGTAFDIAGKGVASHRSLVCAIDAAMLLSKRRLAAMP